MIPRILNLQGLVGLAAALVLTIGLIIQKGETRHWRKQSRQFEQLYQREQAALAGTVANYRAAAEQARAADRAAAERVAAEQRQINERTAHDYETRVAAARAAADRLRETRTAAADLRGGRATPVPALPGAAGATDPAPAQERLSDADRLIATEQAIQLDELIKWVRRQAAVQPNAEKAR